MIRILMSCQCQLACKHRTCVQNSLTSNVKLYFSLSPLKSESNRECWIENCQQAKKNTHRFSFVLLSVIDEKLSFAIAKRNRNDVKEVCKNYFSVQLNRNKNQKKCQRFDYLRWLVVVSVSRQIDFSHWMCEVNCICDDITPIKLFFSVSVDFRFKFHQATIWHGCWPNICYRIGPIETHRRSRIGRSTGHRWRLSVCK